MYRVPSDFTPKRATPVSRAKHEPWKPSNGNVRAFITTPAFHGDDMAFNTRDAVLTFVRAALGSDTLYPVIYGGGYDAKGEFLVVGTASKRYGYYKLAVEACEEAAA
jgi:hypothetical protein